MTLIGPDDHRLPALLSSCQRDSSRGEKEMPITGI
ncbi:unnamed protein product, partial [Staurois parvus]